MKTQSPSPQEIIEFREAIQAQDGIGITAAQDRCAEMLHTSRRAWQQWERGERKMHPAFWELANHKSPAEKPKDVELLRRFSCT